MKIWITGTREAPRENYVATWLAEHLEAAGHVPEQLGAGRAAARIRSSDADLLIHADELRGGYACRRAPVYAAGVNVGGTAMLAQAACEAVVPFVYLSTGEVTIGADLYAITKLAGEQAARLHASKTGVQIVRLSGVYGPGGGSDIDSPMPNRYLEQALAGDELIGHDEVRRAWCYVADAVRAIRLIVEDGRPGIWNVQHPLQDLSMFGLAQACLAAAERDGAAALEAGWAPGVPTTRPADTTALLSLGWAPEVKLEDGLRDTAAWLRGCRIG